MDEWLTRASIWLAMSAWTAAVLCRQPRAARWAWTAGLAFYLGHILLAYAVFYGWSHRIAWEATARETEEVTGWDSGIGLAVNFAFALVLAADLGLQWRGRRRWRWIDWLVAFMILNGAVVFGKGSARWLGAILLALLGARLASRVLRRPRASGPPEGGSARDS